MKKLLLIALLLNVLNACTSSKNEIPVPLEIAETNLKNYHVICIAFDASGTAWLGTLGQGLIRYSSSGISVFDSTNSILNKAAIWDIDVDKKGNVWIGTDDLVKFDGTRFTRINHTQYNLPRNAVRAVEVDGANNVWFSAGAFKQGGLVKYDGNQFTAYTPENSPLPGNLVAGIAIDQENTVWAALNDGITATSMVRIKPDQWKIFGEKELGFNPYYYGNIVTNKQNELVASINYGLSSAIVPGRPQIFRFNGKSSEVINLPQDDKLVYMTQQVFVDRDDRIWAAFWSEKEYGVFRNGSWELKDLDESGGIFAIAQSPSGQIWLGGGKGVFVLK